MQTYLFYDIETTGLSKSFDQILQFAAIRTDTDLNELERYELKIKLNPDVIPAPRALITHHIGIKEAQEGLSEFEAIKQIHQWMNEPGTISLGYNTLGFDDEFLRFSFYRNLLSPYTHQYVNQCGRMDIYPMTVMYYLFKNNVIKWPQKNEKLSLKLEEINSLNQFVSGRAHHAMVDVEATVALAKQFFAEKEMWEHLCTYFNKQKEQERLQQFMKTPAIMVDSVYGVTNNYQGIVLHLGSHNHYKNQTMWLRLDNPELKNVTPETIKECTRVFLKKLGEPSFLLPCKERFLQHLNPDRIKLAEENHQWLLSNPDLLNQIAQYHSEFLYPAYPNVDVQASLYIAGFWSAEETSFCRRFHSVADKEKVLLTENVKLPRIKQLAMRLLGRHYADHLTETQKHYFAEYLSQMDQEENPMVDYRGEKRLNRQTALKEIATLKSLPELSQTQLALLDELEVYLTGSPTHNFYFEPTH